MIYKLADNRLEAVDTLTGDGQHVVVARQADLEALAQGAPAYASRLRLAAQAEHINMETLDACMYGAIAMPRRGASPWSNTTVAFLFCDTLAVFTGATDEACHAIAAAIRRDDGRPTTLDRAVFRFFSGLLQGDAQYLETVEVSLASLEDMALKDDLEGFNPKMSPLRKRIRRMRIHYERMADIADTLVEDDLHFFSEGTLFSLRRYAESVDRLATHAQLLREYALQIQEIYQAQIDIQQNQLDIRQNNIMRVLTVVTTLFFPLSLITSWYGMNFVGMNELQWEHGYAAVIAVSAVIVIVSIVIFKRKKYI